MPNVFGQWAKHFHGKVRSGFDQSDYLQTFDPKFRGGCCMALTAIWIAAGGSSKLFKRFIASKQGQAHVRGFQGLAMEASGPASALGGGYYAGYIMEVLKVFNVTFMGEAAMRDSRESQSSQEVAGFVANKPAFYQFHMSGDDGGHAVGFRNTGKELQFFDPNYGLVGFRGNHKGGLIPMVSTVWTSFYPDLSKYWEIIRVYK